MNYKRQIYYNVLWLQILLGEDEGEEDGNSSKKEDNTNSFNMTSKYMIFKAVYILYSKIQALVAKSSFTI